MAHPFEYPSLLETSSIPFNACVSETTPAYHFLRERHLQAMWLEQKYFYTLSTTEGLPITVLSPGIWNGEAGPDFLRAHIKIGDQEYRGDIEIHLNDESWMQHQHHLDQKYDQVILHVGYWKPKGLPPIATSKGKSIPRTYVEAQLTIPEARILKLIDLDLYPYKHFVGSGTCANALFRTLSIPDIHNFFRKAATWRLIQKKEYLQAKIKQPIDLLAGGMAMALGYKHNSEIFLNLYFLLKEKSLNDESSLLAYAMGICGFFAEKYRKKWFHSIKYQALAWRYDAMSLEMNTPNLILNLERTRPANHPIRRLACMIKILLDPNITTLHNQLDVIWQKNWPKGNTLSWTNLREALLQVLPSYQDTYWEHYYVFEEHPKRSGIALLGRDLKFGILINVYLPLLFHQIELRADASEKEAFYQFYNSFPASQTKKGAYLMHRFFGDTKKKHLLQKADMQQGAYQLHRDFCIHYEASCVGCPFIQRYNTIFGQKDNACRFGSSSK